MVGRLEVMCQAARRHVSAVECASVLRLVRRQPKARNASSVRECFRPRGLLDVTAVQGTVSCYTEPECVFNYVFCRRWGSEHASLSPVVAWLPEITSIAGVSTALHVNLLQSPLNIAF